MNLDSLIEQFLEAAPVLVVEEQVGLIGGLLHRPAHDLLLFVRQSGEDLLVEEKLRVGMRLVPARKVVDPALGYRFICHAEVQIRDRAAELRGIQLIPLNQADHLAHRTGKSDGSEFRVVEHFRREAGNPHAQAVEVAFIVHHF